MRGEHILSPSSIATIEGSSPHARGALRGHIRVDRGSRIIPACAGSTFSIVYSAKLAWDHPRMRGEHSAWRIWRLIVTGSSPHARGAQSRGGGTIDHGGIIPACAGSTAKERSMALTRKGSSPHARGAHFTTSASGRHSRLIHSLFASSSHPSGLSSDYIFARRDTCWHCSNPWRAHRQASRHQYHSVGG